MHAPKNDVSTRPEKSVRWLVAHVHVTVPLTESCSQPTSTVPALLQLRDVVFQKRHWKLVGSNAGGRTTTASSGTSEFDTGSTDDELEFTSCRTQSVPENKPLIVIV